MSIYYEEVNGNKVLRKDLVTTEAEEVARKLVQDTGKNNKKIKSSQLRRFYGDFKSLEKKQQAAPDQEVAFVSTLPLIKMALSKAKYANARNTVPEVFVKWIEMHTKAINSLEDFQAFMLHFEAIVGFCYGYGLKDSN